MAIEHIEGAKHRRIVVYWEMGLRVGLAKAKAALLVYGYDNLRYLDDDHMHMHMHMHMHIQYKLKLTI